MALDESQFKELSEKSQSEYEKVSRSIRDLKAMEFEAVKDAGQYVVALVGTLSSQPALDVKFSSSDSADLKKLKTVTLEFEAKRIKHTMAVSNSISTITETAGKMAMAVPGYGTAIGAGILAIGYVVNAIYVWKSSKPPVNWANRAQDIWKNYDAIGMPVPRFKDGMSPDGYVQYVLEPGVGFTNQVSPQEYADGYKDGGCLAFDAWGRTDNPARRIGGLLGTTFPEVYGALKAYGDAYKTIKAIPEDYDPNVILPAYQQSSNLLYSVKELTEQNNKDPGKEGQQIRWYLGEMIGLYPCYDKPVPKWVRSQQDLINFRDGKNVETFPPRAQIGETKPYTGGYSFHLPLLGGVSFDEALAGQIYADNIINQIVFTAVIKYGVPVWGSLPVLEAARDAWQYYRHQSLELLTTVPTQDWFVDGRIGAVTGVTQLGNLIGSPKRMADVSAKEKKDKSVKTNILLNRMPNGVDAFGFVAINAFAKAQEMANSNFSINNKKFFGQGWKTIASYNEFGASKIQQLGAKLQSELAPRFRPRNQATESVEAYRAAKQAWEIEQAKKAMSQTGTSQAIIIPTENTPVPQTASYDANGQKIDLSSAASLMELRLQGKIPATQKSEMSPAVLAALGIGGAALIGGGGYYLYKRSRR